MALYGIVSDIHGNLQAFRAAADFLLQERGVDRIVCLGDIVGYNADPDACVELTRELAIDAVAGNHDLVAVGALGLARCALRPRVALQQTRRVLSDASRRALSLLPCRRVIEGDVVLVHGGFHDVFQYVTTPERVEENHALMARELPGARICFFGHTHEQALYEIHKGVAVERPAGETVSVDRHGRTFFINPGSVDAARREGERQAEVAVFDSSRRTVSFHRIPYDHAGSEQAAVAHGYRMGAAEESLRRAARTLERRGSAVLRHLRRALPTLTGSGR